MECPRLPNIGEYVRQWGRLVEIETIPPPPPPKPETDYIFEQIEARCEIRLNGEALNQICHYNDFYGENSCVESAIKEMKEYSLQKKITPDSDIEVVVVKITKRYRAHPLKRVNFYDKNFYDFKYLEWKNIKVCRKELPEPTEVVVWSSKTNEV